MQVALQSNWVRQDHRSIGVRGGNAVREIRQEQEKGSAFAVRDIVSLSEPVSRRSEARAVVPTTPANHEPGPVSRAIQELVDEVLASLLHHEVVENTEKPDA